MEDRGDRVCYRDAVYAQVSGFRPLLLDLQVPAAPSPVAVVVYLHGGGFAAGTHQADRDALGARVREELIGRGIAVAGVGYLAAMLATTDGHPELTGRTGSPELGQHGVPHPLRSPSNAVFVERADSGQKGGGSSVGAREGGRLAG